MLLLGMLFGALVASGCGAASDGTKGQSDDSQTAADDDRASDDDEAPVEAGAEPMTSDDDEAEQPDADDDSSEDVEPDPDETDPNETDAVNTDDSELVESDDDTDDSTPDPDLPDPDETAPGETDPDEVDPDEVDPDEPPTPILWQYIQTDTEAYVHNLLGDETQTPITSVVDSRVGTFPWSADGSQLAQIVNGELVFYALEGSATVTARYPAAQYDAVTRWIPGFGVLVMGAEGNTTRLAAINFEGKEFPLDADSATGSGSVSPDGSDVIWRTLAGNEDAIAEYATRHTSIVDGEVGESEVLVVHTSSPMLNPTWSADGGWLAYGVAGSADSDGGIYLWKKGTSAPIRVSPEGTSYAPQFGWSKDGSKFAMYVGNETGSGLYSVGISDAGSTTTTLISANESSSPAEWNGFGALLYSNPDSGWYVPVGADGAPGGPIAFPDYTYGCPVVWLNESEFFHGGCQSTGLTYGQVADGAITTNQISPTSEVNLALSPDGSCLMEWSEPALRIGAADPESYVPTSIQDNSVVWFPSFTADGAQLVYVALGVSLQYIELESCAPVGEPLQRVASGIVENAMLVTPQVR